MTKLVKQQVIVCSSYEQMINVIAMLVQHGLTFSADADSSTIELTGGY